MTEIDFDVVDAVMDVLADTLQTPSQLARKAKVHTNDVHRVLPWLVRNQYLVAVGNGAWTKYRTRRAGEYNVVTR